MFSPFLLFFSAFSSGSTPTFFAPHLQPDVLIYTYLKATTQTHNSLISYSVSSELHAQATPPQKTMQRLPWYSDVLMSWILPSPPFKSAEICLRFCDFAILSLFRIFADKPDGEADDKADDEADEEAIGRLTPLDRLFFLSSPSESTMSPSNGLTNGSHATRKPDLHLVVCFSFSFPSSLPVSPLMIPLLLHIYVCPL